MMEPIRQGDQVIVTHGAERTLAVVLAADRLWAFVQNRSGYRQWVRVERLEKLRGPEG